MSDSTPRILIFGATGGIGRHLSRELAAEGAVLGLVARHEPRLLELARELDALAIPGDMTDPGCAPAAFDAMQRAADGVDAVVQLVGSVELRPLHRLDDADFARCLELNLWSAFRVLREACARMRNGGSACLTSSVAVQTGLPNHEAIAAAKGGVEGLVRSAAASYAPRGLRVNAVAPGLVETPLTEFLTANPAARSESVDLHPLGRLGTPADISRAIRWLIDPANDWVTGQVLAVDGGMGALRHRRRRR